MNEQLLALLAANSGLPFHAITADAHLERDLGLDSLDTVDLIIDMEDRFQIVIPDEDYMQLRTVQQFCDYLQIKVAATALAANTVAAKTSKIHAQLEQEFS